MVTEATQRTLAGIKGLVAWEDGLALARMAATVPADQAIVEVGAHRGLSTSWLAAGSREDGHGARITSIDLWPWEGSPEDHRTDVEWAEEGAMEQHRLNVASVGGEAVVTPVRGSGIDAARGWGGPPVGLWFHDADHSFEAVRDDFEAWLPHLASGCWVAIHDYYGAVPDGSGGWRRVGVLQAAVAAVIVPSSPRWTDVAIIGEPRGSARESPNLWVGRRW